MYVCAALEIDLYMSILSYFARRDFEDETARKKYGFTLAEILITLLIVGFIASLGIPMLGQQKMKKPNQVKIRHGTFECYYDQDGNLHSYYADSEEDPDGAWDEHLVDGSCQFTPPSDSNVMIYAIGAGGTGAMGLSTIPYYIYRPFETSGYVRTDTDFQLSLRDACEKHKWVCENWNKQWDDSSAQQVEYILTSPLGSGGVGRTDRRLKDFDDDKTEEDCRKECAAGHPSCTENCFTVYSANGGKGCKGGSYRIKVKLKKDDNVSYSIDLDKTKIDFNANKYFELLPSGDGRDAYLVNGVPQNGEDCTSYPDLPGANSYMSWENGGGTISIVSSENVPGNNSLFPGGTKSRTRGQISYPHPSQIEYKAKESGIYAYFGLAGAAGSTNFRVYETLPSSIIFRLNPARTSSSNSEVRIIRNGSEELLFNASSGNDRRADWEHLAINKDDSVFPSKYKADDFTEQIPAFSASHGVGYKSKLAELQASGSFMPGKSGAGAYPVLHNVPENNEPFQINGVVVTNGLVQAATYDLPDTCFDGSALKQEGTQYYCGEHENIGNPGAIIIKW